MPIKQMNVLSKLVATNSSVLDAADFFLAVGVCAILFLLLESLHH
jgi:hypothetical protein